LCVITQFVISKKLFIDKNKIIIIIRISITQLTVVHPSGVTRGVAGLTPYRG